MTTLNAIHKMFAQRTNDNKRVVDKDAILKIKPLYSADGMLNMSVQASRKHHSTPRTDEGPYTHVEVGFPSFPPPHSWEQYCKGNYAEKPCHTVYLNVPVELVAQFVDMHCGLKGVDAPKLVLPTPSAEKARDKLGQKRYMIVAEDMGVRV